MSALRRTTLLAVTAGWLVAGFAGVAETHVSVTPDRATPGQFLTYTVVVPNESVDEATVGVELTVPPGVLVETAQAVPGWTVRLGTRGDGTVGSITWSGGRVPPHTFGTFEVRARSPERPGALRWAVTQRYDRHSVAWTGAAGSKTPAASTLVAASASPVAAPGPAPDGTDPLARSRAALALALASAALLVPVGVALRRRLTATPPATPPARRP